MIEIRPPYLLFLGQAHDALAAKTGIACAQWRRELCVGQLRLPGCQADAGLPDLTVEQAAERGARSLILGVVAAGGALAESWVTPIVTALARGMDVVSGMHQRLDSVEPIRIAAARHGGRLIELRHARPALTTGTGRRRRGRRLLTVGTDCSCGKMFASLHLAQAMIARGMKATFRATGQTGMLLAGSGIAIDAVVADFIAGAAEWLSPDADDDHWDVIEGQGSLFHPAFAGVTLGLIHGSQPDALVMCHDPSRQNMRGLPDRPLPALDVCLAASLQAARLTNPAVVAIGCAINTSRLDRTAARALLDHLEQQCGLPCVDPARDGVDRLIAGLPA